MIDVARVLEEAERWAWAPPGSTWIQRDGYLLLISDEAWYTPQVAWSHLQPDDVPSAVEEAISEVRGHRKQVLHWWVRASTDPVDTEQRLLDLGFTPLEDVEILSWDLARDPAEIPVPADVTVTLVDDEAGVRTVHEVGARGFGSPQVTEDAMQRYLEEFRTSRTSGNPTEFNFLARVDGEPAATGGVSLVGEGARLWGASVLPEFRGRGAYRALLAARLRHAAASGAGFALTKARTGTSGPILRRLGFHSHGFERCLSISVG